MRCTIAAVGLALACAAPLAGQTEEALRRAFEGKSVVVRIDMPGTSDGVDVRPGRDMAVDFRRVANRLKEYGTAVHAGQSQMVTKVRVKKDLIEFHLGGGGYGTFGDVMSSPDKVYATSQGKSARERELEGMIKSEADPAKKKAMQRELDSLRRQRAQDDARARAEAAQANHMADQQIRDKRESAGSRFNVRFEGVVPPEYLKPEGLQRALAQYVTFGDAEPAAAAAPEKAAPPPAADGVAALRKGMSLEDVERILGPATTAETTTAGGVTVNRRTYLPDGRKVTAKFVSGVLVEFTIVST
jgi:hypothetical protein